jgi:hypothetical protein
VILYLRVDSAHLLLDRGASPACTDATGRSLRDAIAKSHVDPASPAA